MIILKIKMKPHLYHTLENIMNPSNINLKGLSKQNLCRLLTLILKKIDPGMCIIEHEPEQLPELLLATVSNLDAVALCDVMQKIILQLKDIEFSSAETSAEDYILYPSEIINKIKCRKLKPENCIVGQTSAGETVVTTITELKEKEIVKLDSTEYLVVGVSSYEGFTDACIKKIKRV